MSEQVIHEKYIKAGSPSTPVDELIELSGDEIDNIRRRVAENPRTPVPVLLSLANDEDPEVRVAVAENPSTPSELLARLAADDSLDVRYSLAENCMLPSDIIQKLSEDTNPYVSHRAQRTLRVQHPAEISELKPRPYRESERSWYQG